MLNAIYFPGLMFQKNVFLKRLEGSKGGAE